jgi:Domain of unknown function (DUF4337)
MASLGEISGDGGSKQRERLIAVYIAVLAVALSICSVGGGNATKDATARNIEASNAWAFFQAKNIRRNDVRIEINELELRVATDSTLTEPAKAAIQEKLKLYREQEARLTSEPETGEGVKELMARGKALEAQRDVAMRKDPYFDYGQALLQIAIVLASVSIITGGSVLLLLSGLLAAGGLASMLNGFLLLFG